MELIGNCPHCSREIKVPKEKNKLTRCPYCDEVFSIAKNMRVAGSTKQNHHRKTPITSIDPTGIHKTVCITNIKIPFWSLVGFMMKWVIASIPACIFLIILIFFMLKLLKEYAEILF